MRAWMRVVLVCACVLPLAACVGVDSPGLLGRPGSPDVHGTGAGSWPVTRHVGDGFSRNLHPFIHHHVDGPWLYFASDRDGGSFDIYRRSLSGFAAERLTQFEGDALWPRVSPDGTRLAFAASVNSRWRVFLLELEGALPPSQISGEWGGDCIQPAWTPDGGTLVYAAWAAGEGEWTLHTVDVGLGLDGWGRRLLLTAEGRPVRGLHPCVGADGVISYQGAPMAGRRWFEVRRFDPATGRVSTLSSLRDHGAIQPAFSADGTRMVAATVGKGERRDETGDGFVLLDAWGGLETDIRAPGGMGRVSSPHWAELNGAEHVFFSAPDGGGETIWSIPAGRTPAPKTPKWPPGLAAR